MTPVPVESSREVKKLSTDAAASSVAGRWLKGASDSVAPKKRVSRLSAVRRLSGMLPFGISLKTLTTFWIRAEDCRKSECLQAKLRANLRI